MRYIRLYGKLTNRWGTWEIVYCSFPSFGPYPKRDFSNIVKITSAPCFYITFLSF